jgi:DNA-binding NarL/FixJ family response regulator
VDTNLQTVPVREQEVLSLMASGHTNREIAAQLQTSLETVAAWRAEAMKKLGLQSRIDVILYAERQGWLGEVSKAHYQLKKVGDRPAPVSNANHRLL